MVISIGIKMIFIDHNDTLAFSIETKKLRKCYLLIEQERKGPVPLSAMI